MAGKTDRDAGNSKNDFKPMMFSMPGLPMTKDGQSPFGMEWISRQYAQGALNSFNLFETWLANTRTLMDVWHNSLRQQQDMMLATTRSQLEALTPAKPAKSGHAEDVPEATSPAGQKKKATAQAHEAV